MPGENIHDWSTTAANNDDADTLINWREGMARAAVNDSARSLMAAHAKNRNLQNGTIVTGGTADAQNFTSGVGYTGTVPTGLRALLKIGPTLTNTGAATLNMDSIGDIAIKGPGGTDLKAGDLTAGSYGEFLYDGTNWIFRPSVGVSTVTGVNPGDDDDAGSGGPGGSGVGGGKFETSGVYTPSPNMIYCTIECIGGGGGGGGVIGAAAHTFGGGGGGGGGFSRTIATKAQIGASQVVTIGAGGAGGAQAVNGSQGGTTSVGTLCSAGGGFGGGGTLSGDVFPQGGVGGPAGVGTITGGGGNGFPGCYLPPGVGLGTGGAGGSSILGGGGAPVAVGDPDVSPGQAGQHYGGGGSGCTVRGTLGCPGSPGAAGLVLITEFVA